MFQNNCPFDRMRYFTSFLRQCPSAAARLTGSDEYPAIQGKVSFYQTKYGVLVAAQVSGLPMASDPCRQHIFAFHIHEGNSCSGNMEDAFAGAMAHYNPCNCDHPYHAGDLPPLFGNGGYAFSIFLTDRFCVKDILGKTVIVHLNPDDFTTQPSGNAGEKVACGQIEASF